LPTLYSLYTAASYFNNFNDVTAGRSSFFTSARPGYDLITGLGSPQANQVVQVLVGATTGSFSTAQVKRTIAKAAVRAQTVKLVAATQEQQQNQTVTNSSTHQPVVEIQNITRHDAPIGITENKSESLSINESVANIRVMSDRRVAFHTASALVSEQSTNDAPIVGQFKFSHKSIRSTDHNAEIPHDAIALHDSAMEAGMLAVKENDESATWKQLACLVGAGVVIGTYSAKVRRQKRIIGTP